MKYLLAFILCLCASVAKTEIFLHVYGLSMHQRGNFNNVNLGIGLETKLDDNWSIAGGVYNNSLNQASVFIACKRSVYENNYFVANLQIGLATGYNKSLVPVLIPEICHKYVCGIVIPPVSNQVVGAAAVYLKLPIQN